MWGQRSVVRKEGFIVGEIKHGGWELSHDARPAPSADTTKERKRPFFFFFLAFFVFPLSEYADWLVLTIPQRALLEARSEECPHPCIMKKEGTTALEHLIPVGATLWSQQAV